MTIHLQEVVRSEVEGGLSGPANPIPSQSIDCGCAQLPCPKLAKFATRRLFVGLMSWVGLVQTAAYAYFYVSGPTIARKFQFDPYIMEWVLVISDLTPFLFGLLVAYWGDRIHRVAWIGGIVLLQSVSYFIMIIPHLTHQIKVVEDTNNVTHMSLYADDHRELCSPALSRIIAKDDESCYFTFAMIVVVQIMAGVANVAYFALGISYLDDNTKKKHVAAFIGVIIAVKIVGVLLGYILAWGCLRIDAVTLTTIDSYRDQIGAWWLGFPILTILLIVPGLLLSWFPRMLPSEVVEQAAASLLNSSSRYNRGSRRSITKKVGGTNFWPSLSRLFVNKILICNVLACALYIMAIVNFMGYENLIMQSRFHVPKPIGLMLGFNDPMYSRMVANILKPILIGLIVILTGLVITKAKPSARSVVGYGVVVLILSAGIIFSLTATACEKNPIVGTDDRGLIYLPKYCNKDCGCSNDAEFRPVCDAKGKFTFYSACHAGCTSSDVKNGRTVYSDCSCVEDMTNSKDGEAWDGPCNSNACQLGWLIFEFGSMLAYVLGASSFVGDLLVALRSVYAQDKALSIGFWMMWSAIFANTPGKFLYDTIADLTCQYWGNEEISCHLHDSLKLGNYLCYLTGGLLILCVLLKIVLWFLCKELDLYSQEEKELPPGAEMQQLMPNPSTPKTVEPSDTANNDDATTRVVVTNESETRPTESPEHSRRAEESFDNTPLKYGPIGPGDRRTDPKPSVVQTSQKQKSNIRHLDTDVELSSSDEDGKKDSSSKVPYLPLDLDSDVESDLSNTEPRSRKRIHSKDYDRDQNSKQSSSPRPEFPNDPNHIDFRLASQKKDPNSYLDGSSKTSSFEFTKNGRENVVRTKGDFNEVGIPIMDPPGSRPPQSDARFLKDVKSLINRYELNSDQVDGDGESVKSGESGGRTEYKGVGGFPLVAMASMRPSSRAQSSSGFSSLADGKVLENRPESRGSSSPVTSSKGSKGTLHTDF
ncbi:solute carrier organic anion transporter family member 1A5 isoform X2 [Colletes gigas]|uniref:solute carrier organic anion transporter family member 1A5 isoform X2 n=1 Tax=Colletes gigas TaxID=935657 RepID=UPI001C9B4251|nr:solute carrier organic anion transporter family member 1A5 isoform X2 [Colletes gigas]